MKHHNSNDFRDNVAACISTEAVEQILNIITSLPDEVIGDRTGGFLSVNDTQSLTMAVEPFGHIPKEKIGQYFRNATEKATRLAKFGGLRSYDTRDEGLEHWGGGIRFGNLIVAFSGFPEMIDEALSLIYAVYSVLGEKLGPFSLRKQVENQMEHYPGNEFITPILDKFLDWHARQSSSVVHP